MREYAHPGVMSYSGPRSQNELMTKRAGEYTIEYFTLVSIV